MAMVLNVATVASAGVSIGSSLGQPSTVLATVRVSVAEMTALSPALRTSLPAGAVAGQDNERPTWVRTIPVPERAFTALAQLKTCRLAMSAAAVVPTAGVHKAKPTTVSKTFVVREGSPTSIHTVVYLPAIQAGAFTVPVAEGPSALTAPGPFLKTSLSCFRPRTG